MTREEKLEEVARLAKDLIKSFEAFREFERQSPNDCSKKWDAVFDAKDIAESQLTAALAALEE